MIFRIVQAAVGFIHIPSECKRHRKHTTAEKVYRDYANGVSMGE